MERALLEEVERFARAQVLVAFDFDGVLAPLVAARERARVSRRLAPLLTDVARRYPCIVVSGRSLDDLRPRVAGVPLAGVFGNFGWEPDSTGRGPHGRVRQWVATLRANLAGRAGVQVEDKGYSVAVHYRHSPHPEVARRAVARAIAGLPGARVLEGTLAYVVVPAHGPDKGRTLQRARRAAGCTHAIYVGDDGTDEVAFDSGAPTRLLSVRMGPTGRTVARFRLPHERALAELLRALSARRPLTSTPESGPRAPRATRRW